MQRQLSLPVVLALTCGVVLGQSVAAQPSHSAGIQIAQAPLTGDEVVSFIREMEKLTNDRNVEELVNRIAPNVDFQVSSDIGAAPVAFKQEQLRPLFNEGFSGLEFYEVRLTIDSIEIEGNKATVMGTTLDRASIDGTQLITTNISWTNLLEKRDGQLQVVQWQSQVDRYCVSAL